MGKGRSSEGLPSISASARELISPQMAFRARQEEASIKLHTMLIRSDKEVGRRPSSGCRTGHSGLVIIPAADAPEDPKGRDPLALFLGLTPTLPCVCGFLWPDPLTSSSYIHVACTLHPQFIFVFPQHVVSKGFFHRSVF